MCFSANFGVAAIIGIVIGCIVVIAIVVGVCAVCVFGLGKHRGSSGNVITPNTGTQSKHAVYPSLRITCQTSVEN